MTLEMKYKEKFNEGKLYILIQLVKDNLLKLDDAIEKSGLSKEEFLQEMKSKTNN